MRLDGDTAQRNGAAGAARRGFGAACRRVWPELGAFAPDVVEQLEIDAQYAGYLDRQDADIWPSAGTKVWRCPAGLDYRAVCGFPTEAAQKLTAIRPATLGQAARIDGVTPAALTLVLAHVKGRAERRAA